MKLAWKLGWCPVARPATFRSSGLLVWTVKHCHGFSNILLRIIRKCWTLLPGTHDHIDIICRTPSSACCAATGRGCAADLDAIHAVWLKQRSNEWTPLRLRGLRAAAAYCFLPVMVSLLKCRPSSHAGVSTYSELVAWQLLFMLYLTTVTENFRSSF